MMSILDAHMHQDENFFIYNMEMGTPFYGVMVSEFSTKTPHLILGSLQTAYYRPSLPVGKSANKLDFL
jgi:hypothetical protein